MSKVSSADQIEQTIIREAQADAKRIVDDAEVEARQHLIEAQETAQANLAGWAARRKQMAQGSGDRILGKAQNDAHIRVMNAKARIMDEAFEQARKRFEKERETAKYKTFLSGIIIDAGIQIGGGDLVVLSRKEDQPVISKITGLGAAITKGAGKTAKVSVGKKTVDMIGGVMVQNKDGNITVDYRVETLLAQVEIKFRNEIAKILFPKEAEPEKVST